MSSRLSNFVFENWLTLTLWLVLCMAGLALRPLLPIDETRYLTVAWEMHNSGSYLVPHLNGELYSHKPPLLFWLMNAGWAVLGISETWARMVAPLFGLASLLMSVRIADELWPQNKGNPLLPIRNLAPMMLLTAGYWAVFSTMTMFDMLLTFATMVGVLGVLKAWRGYSAGDRAAFWWGIALTGLGLGLGGLSKGPVILLHVLPVYLFAPWWGKRLTNAPKQGWLGWYVAVLAAFAIGLGISLSWAIPAAIKGGPEYRDAIFVGQAAGRMVKSFAHQRPPWWFLQYFPLILLPWFAWPRLWRAIGFVKSWRAGSGLKAALSDGGVRFLSVWFGITLLAFSAISGKQLHYLLPEFPALALIAAFLLSKTAHGNDMATSDPGHGRSHRIPALILAVLATLPLIAWAALPVIGGYTNQIPGWAYEAQPLWMVPAVVVALAAAWTRMPDFGGEARLLAICSATLVVFLTMAASPALKFAYDLSLPAQLVASWQQQDRAIAYVGKYHGEFHFLGRLEKPIVALDSHKQAPGWAKEHPKGILISTLRANEIKFDPIAVFPYRGRFLVMWEAPQTPKRIK
ncbi:MAG: glycosyltransferase family 39 protein [Rhodospirillaceae bacterium]|nr:glycosyltransferase family 39 protein [Rhodospirillaceae bacterium]